MNQETKVGLFVLIIIAGLLPFMLFIGNIKLFERTKTYYIDFQDVEALPPKASVKVSGVEVGKVGKIQLVNHHARVKIRISPDVVVYENAVARVASTGLIGTRFIDFDPGTSDKPRIPAGSVIRGASSESLNQMISKLSKLFEDDPKHGNAVDNLRASLANIRKTTEALGNSIGERENEMTEIIVNIRDITRDLSDVVSTRKEDLKVALLKFREISEKLDTILGKIDRGEGTIGALVSDKKMEGEVREAVTSLKDTAASAKNVLARFTVVRSYWSYRYRYDFADDESRSDLSIKLVPRKGKFYAVGVTNIGEVPDNEKTTQYERKNRITAVIGGDWGPFTGYAGAIRSDGGIGLDFRPLWFTDKWKNRVELTAEAADFNRDRVVRGNHLDTTWVSVGAKLALNRWLWVGARAEDLFERTAVMSNVNVIFEDKDFAYLLGLASAAH